LQDLNILTSVYLAVYHIDYKDRMKKYNSIE
jgi:hypothetical protein